MAISELFTYLTIAWLFVGPIVSGIGCTIIVQRHAEKAWDRFYDLGFKHGREMETFDRDLLGDASVEIERVST